MGGYLSIREGLGYIVEKDSHCFLQLFSTCLSSSDGASFSLVFFYSLRIATVCQLNVKWMYI